jgi:hypothetical protein
MCNAGISDVKKNENSLVANLHSPFILLYPKQKSVITEKIAFK